MSHLCSGIWLSSMTVPVVTVNCFWQPLCRTKAGACDSSSRAQPRRNRSGNTKPRRASGWPPRTRWRSPRSESEPQAPRRSASSGTRSSSRRHDFVYTITCMTMQGFCIDNRMTQTSIELWSKQHRRRTKLSGKRPSRSALPKRRSGSSRTRQRRPTSPCRHGSVRRGGTPQRATTRSNSLSSENAHDGHGPTRHASCGRSPNHGDDASAGSCGEGARRSTSALASSLSTAGRS